MNLRPTQSHAITVHNHTITMPPSTITPVMIQDLKTIPRWVRRSALPRLMVRIISAFSATLLTKTIAPVRHMPRQLNLLALKIKQPDLPQLTRHFLFNSLNPDSPIPIAVNNLPEITGKIRLYNSAHVVYYAPSDVSGMRGMHHERIRSTVSWHSGRP